MGTLAAIGATALSRQGSSGPAWVPSIHIDGTTFSTTQILPGLAGAYDATTNANRVYMAAGSSSNLAGGSLWSCVIKGTDATMKISRASGVVTNAVSVSVDGGAFSVITASGTNPTFDFPLFSGLSDAEHFVVTRIGSAFGIDQMYLDETLPTCLSISGTSTYIEVCDQWVYPAVASALAVAAGMTKTSAVNYFPAKTKQNIVTGASNISSAKIKGPFQAIQVASTGTPNTLTAVYVSKNGAAPTKYAFADKGQGFTYRVTGLDGTNATYYVWTDCRGESLFAVSGDADHVDCGTKYQVHQFGDSITLGGSSAIVAGEVDVLRVAASMGYVALTAGVGGSTIAQLETALTTYLAALTVTANDVAILAIGRNNTGGAFDGAETTSYTNIVNALVTKGYGKIICRGILPSGTHSTEWTAENGSISSIVTGIGNANVVFCDVSGLGTYTTQASDGTHPDTSGYATIAAYVEPLYRTILGL